MSRPASKPADMYNYRVAAYLKTSEYVKIDDCLLKNLEFAVLPPPLQRDNTFLNVEVLFDIVISGPDREFLCECKYQQIPRPAGISSVAVKESLLEFIAAEKYRLNSFKRDVLSYVLITNCPVANLEKQVSELKVADDPQIKSYGLALKKCALKKWANFDPKTQIEAQWIRSILMRLNVMEIDEGRLQEAAKNPTFKKALDDILAQLSQRHPEIVPLKNRLYPTIRFEIPNSTQPVMAKKQKFIIEISPEIVNQVLAHNSVVKSKIEEYRICTNCQVIHNPEIKIEHAVELITEALNDEICKQGRSAQFVSVNPWNCKLLFVNTEWLYQIAKRHRPKGFYEMAKIAQELPLRLSRFSLATILSECLRLKNNVARPDVMDWTGFVEPSN